MTTDETESRRRDPHDEDVGGNRPRPTSAPRPGATATAERRRPGRPRVDPSNAAARQALLDAAEALFAERGFHATPTSAVAKRAGVTPGLVFYYFGTKEGLLAALLEERSFLPSLRDLVADSGADTLEDLLAEVGATLFRLANRDVPAVRIVLREALQRDALRASWNEAFEGAVDALAARLEPFAQAPRGDPAAVARVFLHAVAFQALFGAEDADAVVGPAVAAVRSCFGRENAPPARRK